MSELMGVCVCIPVHMFTSTHVLGWGQAEGNLKELRLSMADVETGTVSGALGDCGDLPHPVMDRQCHLP